MGDQLVRQWSAAAALTILMFILLTVSSYAQDGDSTEVTVNDSLSTADDSAAVIEPEPFILTSTNGHVKRLLFYVSAGVRLPVEAFGDRANTGFGGILALGFAPRSLSLGGEIELMLRLQADRFGSSLDSGPNFTFLSAGMDLKFNIDPTAERNFYLLFGGGVTQTRWSSYDTPYGERARVTTNDFYGSAGTGLTLKGKSVSPFMEARLTDVSGARMGNLYFLTLSVGLRL